MAHILLLAEPSLTIQRVVQLTFANEDIDVVVASDGVEAIELAERVRPSVVLADVSLARTNGYDLAAHFKRHARFAGVPVVLLSGAFERVDAARAASSGCDLVISKPFEPRHLLAHVKGLLPGAAEGHTSADTAATDRVAPAGFVPAASHGGNATASETPPPEARRTEPTPVPAESPVPVPPVEVAPTVDPAALFTPPPTQPPAPPAPHPAGPRTEAAGASPASPAGLPPALANWMRPEPVEAPKVTRRPAEPPPTIEPVPSFEMLALTNKSMRLVPPPSVPEEADPEPDMVETAPDPVPANRGGHDLGDLIPSLDDYFDQLDAAFASGVDTAFRRSPNVAQPAAPLPPQQRTAMPAPSPDSPPMLPPMTAPARQEPPMPSPPPAFVDRRQATPAAPAPAAERGPAVSPFSTLRLEQPDPRPAPAASATIDDAYDALMKQLQEPKQRPSVVALRADDELLVERAVERVLAQLDSAALREAMSDVVTNLTKKVIAEEIERIRRP